MTTSTTPTATSVTTGTSATTETSSKPFSQPSSFKPIPYPQVPPRPVYPQYPAPSPPALPPRPYQPTSSVTPQSPVYPQYTPPTTTKSAAQTFPSIVFQPPPSTPSVLPKYVPRQPVPIPVRPVPSYPSTPYYNVISGQSVISGQLKKCLRGYRMNMKGECEDINECDSNPCSKHEKCINFNGGFQCAPPIIQCKRGMELNEAGDQCIDINECTRNLHKCNPSQICKNYPGYYTCECPPGHHLKANRCDDIDECKIFRPCGTYANCINTKGSYKCECKEGFRETNNSCEDFDECAADAGLCEHMCVNTWGSYRCSCSPGFTLNADNRTCTDVDECERFKDKRLCIGTCVNVPGSYKCECPKGYKLGSDNRVCLDIDECEQSNVCLSEEVCLNTRGSFKCYSIKCPENYVKDVEHKARCKRIQTACDPREWNCQLMPEQYTYQYITLVSNLPLTHGKIQLFQIKGPQWNFTRAEFSMKLLDVICPFGVDKVNDFYFHKMTDQHTMSLYLVRSIQGPQEIKLQIEMRLYKGNTVLGNAVVYIIIVVSEYPF
nr:unnamed protein product [Callosobruchus chinensis]